MKTLVAALAAAVSVAGLAAAGDFSVPKDQSKVIRLAAPAATVVVGNPAIADVTMKDGVTAFVTGKSYGSTNMIAMDAEGRQIASFAVIVTPASERSVTLMKGARKTTLSCAPRCQEVGEATAAAAAE